MRKMKLDIDGLEVETFAVTPEGADASGTVFGWMPRTGPLNNDSIDCGGGGGATGPSNPVCIGPTYCCNPTANTTCCPAPTWQATCAYSCRGSCGETCAISCYPDDCLY